MSGMTCGDSNIENIYKNTNQNVENMAKFLDVFISRILVSLSIILPVIASVYKYVSSDYSNKAFLQIYPAT